MRPPSTRATSAWSLRVHVGVLREQVEASRSGRWRSSRGPRGRRSSPRPGAAGRSSPGRSRGRAPPSASHRRSSRTSPRRRCRIMASTTPSRTLMARRKRRLPGVGRPARQVERLLDPVVRHVQRGVERPVDVARHRLDLGAEERLGHDAQRDGHHLPAPRRAGASRLPKGGAPSRRACPRRRAPSASRSPAIRSRWKAGCIVRRWRSQKSPSFVSRPSPRISRSLAIPRVRFV